MQTKDQLRNALELCDTIRYAIETNRRTGATSKLLECEDCTIVFDSRQAAKVVKPHMKISTANLLSLHSLNGVAHKRVRLIFDNSAIAYLASTCSTALRNEHSESPTRKYARCVDELCEELRDIQSASFFTRFKWLFTGYKISDKAMSAISRLTDDVTEFY